jgi:hypothetical protein
MLGGSDRSTGYGGDAPDTAVTAPSLDEPTYTSPRAPVPGGVHAAPTATSAGRRARVAGGVKVKGGGALALVGLLTVVLGAWAGIVAYLGPAIKFGATGSPAWTWSLPHTLLWLVPGAVALLCGLIFLAKVPSLRNGRGGGIAGLAAFLVVLCGAWLVIGPLAWPVLRTGAVFTGGSVWHDFLTRVGYSYGPGVILAMLGGTAMGLVVGRRLTGLAMVATNRAGTSTIPTSTSAIPAAGSQPF